jgi:peroxiredoxin
MPTDTINRNGRKPTRRGGGQRLPRAPRTRTEARAAVRAAAKANTRGRQRRGWLLWTLGVVVVGAVIGAMMFTARDTQNTTTRLAPDFTLTNTAGQSVHLADYRGKNVVLYFSEGAGCQACLTQMGDIERHQADFAAANVTVLPIVMNTADEIRQDMAANDVRTPFLIDSTGQVSRQYDTLGKGMHAGLPGHSFILVDTKGTQRWSGEYPSMYLSSADLLKQVRSHLP